MVTLYTKKGIAFQIDAADFAQVERYVWHFEGRYIARYFTAGGGRMRKQYLHHFLLGAGFIDHRKRDRLDYRRENLRSSSKQLNAANMAPRSRSGFKGVAPNGKKWAASITVDGRAKYLGSFKSPLCASAAYKLHAAAFFGEHACYGR